jgi:probable F420-dependent oxidoreductase
MARSFRFALQARNLADRQAVMAAAVEAEGLGYEEMYSYDHLGTVDPFIPLIVAAEATSRLRVGPLVLNNELHHPVLLARTVATADRLTGGRMVLGMGTGYAQSEHDAMDILLRPPRSRVDRLEESLRALRSCLDQGSVEASGTYHRLTVVELGVRPIQDHVPILVGGHGRRVIRVAGELADIFQFTGISHRPDGTPDPAGFRLEAIEERARWLTKAEAARAAVAGRDGVIERSVLVQRTVIGSGAESALDEATQELGLERAAVESTPFLLFGTVEQVVDRLERLRESLGISHVVVRQAAEFAPVVAALAGR